MRKNILVTLCAATFLAPLALHAQQPDMIAMHCGGEMPAMSAMPGMKAGSHEMGGMGALMETMMGPPAPAMILEHRNDLKLTTTQVTRLQALQKQAQPECARHMTLAMAAHLSAARLLDAPAPDFAAYAVKMREATGHMVEGQVAMAKAAVAARDVLTPAQRADLKASMAAMHKK